MSTRHHESPAQALQPPASPGQPVAHGQRAGGHARHHRPSTPSRDPLFDNAKFLLVTLVVIGHSWTLLPDVSTSSPVYTFLYAWHVPAFVLVTGYLSRKFTFTRRNLMKVLTTIVVPYFVFESLLALFRITVGGESFGPLYLSPHWPMWYLTALFLWRMATPLLNKVPHPMVLAVAISLVGGANTLDWLDLPRTMGLLPFFVAGLTLRREHFERLAHPRVRATAAVLLACAFVAAVFVGPHISKELLYWRTGYPDLGLPFWLGMLCRGALLVVAGVLVLSALSLIPTSQRWFTRLGSASLVVYLFHGFAVKGAEYAGIGGASQQDPVTAFLLVTGGAVALSLLLSATPVSRRLNRLVDPISTLTEAVPALVPGQVPPEHHRRLVDRRVALSHRDPTRLQ